MLFISEMPSHVAVKSETKALYDTRGRLLQPKEPRIYAKFKRGEAPEFARKIGVEIFALRQRPPEVDPGDWLASFDSVAAQASEGWSDDKRELVEETLIARGYTRVEAPRLPAPYPMYDKHRKTAGKRTVDHAITDILAAYESAGFNVAAAIAYERENGNDAQVVAALETLVSEPVEAEQEPVIAA